MSIRQSLLFGLVKMYSSELGASFGSTLARFGAAAGLGWGTLSSAARLAWFRADFRTDMVYGEGAMGQDGGGGSNFVLSRSRR